MGNASGELYKAPGTEVLRVDAEGIICRSEVKGGNSVKNWEDDGSTDDNIYM